MGWLSKLKSIFSSGEKKPERECAVKISELDSWLEKETREIVAEKEKDMKGIFTEIKEHMGECSEKLSALNEAKLMNEKIPERVRQILLGNKDEYGKKVNFLLKHITPPEQISRETVRKYCSDFEDTAAFFKKNTEKQVYVLNEFHKNESFEVSKSIKAIEDCVVLLKGIVEGNDFKSLDALGDDIHELGKIIKEKTRIENEIKEQKNDFEDTKARLQKTEEELQELLKSSEFSSIEEAKQKRNNLNNESERIAAALTDRFSNMRKALEKFKRGRTTERLIDRYLEDALAELMEDDKLEIASAIEDLQKSIELGQLELKDNVRQQALQACKSTSREELSGYASRYTEIINELETLNKRIEESTAVKIKEDLDNRHDFLNEKIGKLKESIKRCEESLQKITLDDIKEKIAADAKELLGCNLVIEEAENKEKLETQVVEENKNE